MKNKPSVIEESITNNKGESVSISLLKDSFTQILASELIKEFEVYHLSKQLCRSIRIGIDEYNRYHIFLPAQIYDINYYRKYGVIKHTGTQGYAMDVNKDGGFSGKHKNFVINCINNAIVRWAGENKITVKVDATGVK